MLKQSKPTEAEPFLRASLSVLQRERPEAWMTFHAKASLGAALAQQQQYEDAEPLLLEGYQGMRNSLKEAAGQKHGTTWNEMPLRDALEYLVQLYDAWGKSDESAKWRKELEKRDKKR